MRDINTLYVCMYVCIRRLQRWEWERVGRGKLLLYVAICSAAQRASAPAGEERGGAYRGGRLPTACYASHRVDALSDAFV